MKHADYCPRSTVTPQEHRRLFLIAAPNEAQRRAYRAPECACGSSALARNIRRLNARVAQLKGER